jgi:hypothetical protein
VDQRQQLDRKAMTLEMTGADIDKLDRFVVFA